MYRKGLEQAQWSYSAAVGLFNSVVNFVIIVLMNRFPFSVAMSAFGKEVPHEGAFSIRQDFSGCNGLFMLLMILSRHILLYYCRLHLSDRFSWH